jgi:PIN domain nuclease of toxin-antitoxin system
VAQPSAVLDASALLAWLHLEPGALAVRAALDNTAAMSVVNWAEVLTKLADLGQDPVEVRSRMFKEGIFEKDLLLWPLDEAMAVEVAKLRAKTRSRGLSLGDRACIALGQHLRLPILTSDRAWKTLHFGVQIHLIR